MDTQDTNANVVRVIRRANAEMPINLSHRRNWYDSKSDTTDKTDTTETPATTEPGNDADTGASNTGEKTPPTLPITQKDLTGMLTDRAGQAKRNALSDLAKSLEISDVTELSEIVKAHKQAEEKRKEDEEAQKSELQKKDDLLNASTTLQATQAQTIKILRIESAIMRLAPAKEIPADRFMALLKLMDMDSIPVTDDKIDDKDVEAALDKTLADNEFLKSQSSNGQGYGSPSRKSPPPSKLPNPQPVKRKYGGI